MVQTFFLALVTPPVTPPEAGWWDYLYGFWTNPNVICKFGFFVLFNSLSFFLMNGGLVAICACISKSFVGTSTGIGVSALFNSHFADRICCSIIFSPAAINNRQMLKPTDIILFNGRHVTFESVTTNPIVVKFYLDALSFIASVSKVPIQNFGTYFRQLVMLYAIEQVECIATDPASGWDKLQHIMILKTILLARLIFLLTHHLVG